MSKLSRALLLALPLFLAATGATAGRFIIADADMDDVHDDDFTVPAVPEPSGLLLMAAGLGTVALARRRRR